MQSYSHNAKSSLFHHKTFSLIASQLTAATKVFKEQSSGCQHVNAVMVRMACTHLTTHPSANTTDDYTHRQRKGEEKDIEIERERDFYCHHYIKVYICTSTIHRGLTMQFAFVSTTLIKLYLTWL